VSHELRTPITSINLLLETLQNGVDEPEMARYFLRRIQVETQSMMRLVEELLELSRLESGRLPLRLEAVDVHAIFQRVLQRLQAMAEEKDISLTLDLQTGLPTALADAHGLEQVLMNLTHNAIKFTPSSGDVSLRARRQGRAVHIEVADTGPGIDPDEVDRVFERFYKADKGRNRASGSGLGLAVARHLVELHGGKLRVISEPGRGSRFLFSVPVSEETAGVAEERME
jgi:two-component system phosphate regulon sensor histidine kinase PhoR